MNAFIQRLHYQTVKYTDWLSIHQNSTAAFISWECEKKGKNNEQKLFRKTALTN